MIFIREDVPVSKKTGHRIHVRVSVFIRGYSNFCIFQAGNSLKDESICNPAPNLI